MNAAGPSRSRRIDAARNAERIVVTAREVFASEGSEVPLEEIARRAGVGIATLYRHFPSREELVRAILRWRFVEEIEPAIQRALSDVDTWRATVTVLEAAMSLATGENRTVLAARNPAALLADLADRLFDALWTIVRNAQAAGTVRADLARDDLAVITIMLISTLQLDDPPAVRWPRYLALILDSLRPAAATPLPPAGDTPPRQADDDIAWSKRT